MAEAALIGYLKPRPAEATAQLRNSLAALALLLVLTSLLPLPSLPAALHRYAHGRYASALESLFVRGELLATALLLMSAAQAAWGVFYPRVAASKPAATTPAKTLAPPPSAPTPEWRRIPHGLSPNTTPQRQRPFAVPSTSDPRGIAGGYALGFVPPSVSPGDASRDSSTLFTPSPSPLAGIRGKRALASSTRALDESILAALNGESDSEDEEEDE